MKKLMFFACVILFGCEGNVETKSTPYIINGRCNVEIHVIDSCEYIRVCSGSRSWGSHKGNCKFCAERNKK